MLQHILLMCQIFHQHLIQFARVELELLWRIHRHYFDQTNLAPALIFLQNIFLLNDAFDEGMHIPKNNYS